MTNLIVLAATQAERIGLRSMLDGCEGLAVLDTLPEVASLDDLPSDVDVVVVTSDTLSAFPLESLVTEDGPALALLLLSDDEDDLQAIQNLDGHAWGLLPRDSSQDELLAAIRALSQGLVVLPPYLLTHLSTSTPAPIADSENELIDKLTPRENEVLQLLAQGLANKQIAVELGVSEHTVKFHVTSIYGKLGASNRADVIRLGFEYGLIVL
jgi:DNA-binding NarL/FixJ family response regulator